MLTTGTQITMDEQENHATPSPSDEQPSAETEDSSPLIAGEVTSPLPADPAAVVPLEPPPQPVLPSIRLEKKHPLAIRWMHWVNFPVLFTMIWSGLLIYWNDSDNAYQHPHAVYRVGIGPFTLIRFFPDWFWKAMNAPYHVT